MSNSLSATSVTSFYCELCNRAPSKKRCAYRSSDTCVFGTTCQRQFHLRSFSLMWSVTLSPRTPLEEAREGPPPCCSSAAASNPWHRLPSVGPGCRTDTPRSWSCASSLSSRNSSHGPRTRRFVFHAHPPPIQDGTLAFLHVIGLQKVRQFREVSERRKVREFREVSERHGRRFASYTSRPQASLQEPPDARQKLASLRVAT